MYSDYLEINCDLFHTCKCTGLDSGTDIATSSSTSTVAAREITTTNGATTPAASDPDEDISTTTIAEQLQ